MPRIIASGTGWVLHDIEPDLPRHTDWPHGRRWAVSRPGIGMTIGRWVQGAAYRRVEERLITDVWLHHTAGSITPQGTDGPVSTARFVIRQPPTPRSGKPDYRYGRNWAGYPYHINIPQEPLKDDQGRWIIYQCWHPDWTIWHTLGRNEQGLGIVCQGSFSQIPGDIGTERQPSFPQVTCLQGLWDEYLKPLHGLTNADIRGHADASKPTCPGGRLMQWVKETRGG